MSAGPARCPAARTALVVLTAAALAAALPPASVGAAGGTRPAAAAAGATSGARPVVERVRVPMSFAAVSGLNLPGLQLPPDRSTVRHVRLWDAGVTWSAVERRRGVYDWSRLDALVGWARRQGTTVMLVLGPGPRLYSPGGSALRTAPGSSTLPPRTLTAWTRYVTAVVTRYRGRIASYEPWNEVNLGMFYQGTPHQMALMTRALKQVVDRVDPRALVSAGSVTPSSEYSRTRAAQHLLALRALGWPVDLFNLHLYNTPGTGAAGVRRNTAWYLDLLRRLGAPRLPVWGTEAGLNEPRGVLLDAEQTRTAMTRVTVDAMLQGLTRVYWYAWLGDIATLPVKIWPGSPGEAVLRGWSGSSSWRLLECRRAAVYTCTLGSGARRRAIRVGNAVVTPG